MENFAQAQARAPDLGETSAIPVRLVPLPNGPYEVTGLLEIARPDGDPIGAPASKVHLCRCGRSADKPFCDGSHARTGWTDGA
ncbi:CDGSH iron-sulfur domain-containing protein [Geodermatophilus sp. TF02-6]|uniref:CDGSH iron-sulfur domain-containing protein n=1 Tax=Geodermatophilus sp. TF02-6 TaxID=2250575 RepID=UPI000DEB8D79|nr:CDGSH iron-sulfur domain-containing protein [Geodermatophilus sp. TF02-6]RBY76865.1 CDGSH iron-sulfur domain-containing protein [Geodermatophilus sp. TF02-6]